MSRRHTRANAMHPRNAIPFAGRGHYRPALHVRPPRPHPDVHAVAGWVLATVLGTALAAVLFIGLSGGFRP
jgi:hypothetical protein